MLKKVLILIFLSFFAFTNANAIKIKSIGKAVIENNDLRSADKFAREDALLNALTTYFESISSNDDMPEITTEFLKFIRSYKILERYVSDFTVYYNIEAEVDEIAKSDLNHYLNSVSHSVVYFIKVNKDDSMKDININSINKLIKQAFESHSFLTKYQESFDLSLSNNPDFEEIMKQFSINRARFLFYIEIGSNCDQTDELYDCQVTTISRIFTKQKNFPVIKAPTNEATKDKTETILKAFDKNINNVLNYIRENFIPLPKIDFQINDISIVVENYKRFTDIKDIFNELRNKKIINSYTINSYNSNNVVFDVKSTFNQTELISKIKAINKDNKYNVKSKDNSIIITFISESLF